ncbi:MAG: hypothetical protein NTV26_07705 [Caldiserica bacterium]|nr:hypothetical protein [Caldisericota bacterium]
MEQFLQSVDIVLNSEGARLAFGFVALVLCVVTVILLVQWGRQRTRLARIFGRAADPSFYARIDALTRAFDQQVSTEKELRAACVELEQTSHSFFDTVDIEHYAKSRMC